MLSLYKKLYTLLTKRERRNAAFVLGLLLMVAAVETLGVASIMPFVAMLSSPDKVAQYQFVADLRSALSLESDTAFLIALSCGFLSILLVSLALQAVGVWAQLRFSQYRNYSWSVRLLERYLKQPYDWFLTRNSAELATSVLSEVQQVVNGALFPLIQLLANALVAILIVTLLIIIDPFLAAFTIVTLGGSYLLIAIVFRRTLRRVSRQRRLANKRRFKVVQEALTGIKEVKILSLESNYRKSFNIPARRQARSVITAGIVAQTPSFAMQGLLFGGMIVVLLITVIRSGGILDALPIVALYAFAGYRLMPAIQKVYANASSARFSEAAIDALVEDLNASNESTEIGSSDTEESTDTGISELRLAHQIKLSDVSFTYPAAKSDTLRGISLTIRANTSVAFVGSTGSGKTTLMDCLLGLLRPKLGNIEIDGVELNSSTARAWQSSLGYVPQNIFLADDTIAANIALGVKREDIDYSALERASRAAALHDFVESELPDKYDTIIGDRGIRLSGGQRQRIGIARALYKDPSVLFLDEATSALDNKTEKHVMGSIRRLGKDKTLIIIAHRLSTVKNCDCIYFVEGGKIVDSGTYEALVANNSEFRRIAEGA